MLWKHLIKLGLQMMYSVSILVLLETTALFEKHHKEYLDTGKAQTQPHYNFRISSWVAHDLQSSGQKFHTLLLVRLLCMQF
jgi:hypothetical protein